MDKKTKNKSKGLMQEFKTFIMRGNVMDLAVGVLIGGAFQKIVTSLVNDIITPVVSLATQLIAKQGVDFSNWFIALDGNTYLTVEQAQEVSAVINIGALLTNVIDFLIMAFVIFWIVKGINSLGGVGKKTRWGRKKKEPKAEPKPEPTTKTCPYCLSEVPIAATRCAHCTSMLDDESEEGESA